MPKPIIGITVSNRPDADNQPPAYLSSVAYSRAVADSGGVPFLLPQEISLVHDFARSCSALLFTGGDDPRTEPFGQPTHPKAQLMPQLRQDFDLALLQAANQLPQKPILGVCLGMQLMALLAQGSLNQHLPDTLGQSASLHANNNTHPITLNTLDSPLTRHIRNPKSEIENPKTQPLAANTNSYSVTSHHHQAVSNPGRLRAIAVAPDGVIEAIDDPNKPFYLGVQWHPERSALGPLNLQLIRRFVLAASQTQT